MEVDAEPIEANNVKEELDGGLDSDDETLRFVKDDDLYDGEADEEDAKWVAQQHRPAAEWEREQDEEQEGGGGPSANGKSNTAVGDGHDDADSDADEDETVVDEPPTISDRTDAPAENQQQQGGGNSSSSSSVGGGKKRQEGGRGGGMGVASDAQLSCPLCFTTVCLECQRHAKYSNQFRAVTGTNVSVNYDVFLTLDEVSGGGGGRGKTGRKHRGNKAAAAAAAARDSGDGVRQGTQQPADASGEGPQEEEEMFHPVCCGECDHRVGVYDAEEVFHFFGVVASG